MRVAVTGGRSFTDKALLIEVLSHYKITSLLHGGCTGVDKMAAEWAANIGIDVVLFKANWDQYGAIAGPVRNAKMLRNGKPDLLIAFTGGKGTANCKAQAKELGIPVIVIENPKEKVA